MGTMDRDVVLLGKRITAAREARRWTRSDLARKAGVDPSYVTRIEEAHYKRPSVDKVAAIARALGIPVTDLTEPPPDLAAGVAPGELEAMFRPDETLLVAAVARGLKRHSPRRRRQILEAMAAFVGADDENGE